MWWCLVPNPSQWLFCSVLYFHLLTREVELFIILLLLLLFFATLVVFCHFSSSLLLNDL